MLLKGIKLLIVIFVLTSFFSCTKNKSQNLVGEISSSLDSLKNVYIPDSRVAYWNNSVEVVGDTMKIQIELDSKIIQNDVYNILSKNYPKADISVLLLPDIEEGEISYGLINNSVANLRSKQWHAAELSNQVLLGTPVKILKKEQGWYLIQTPNQYISWTDGANVARIDKNDVDSLQSLKKVVYIEQYGFSYSEPDKNSQVVTDLVVGCILPVLEESGKFYKVLYPDKRKAYVMQNEVLDASEVFSKNFTNEEIVATAKKFYGIPYLWGGTSSKGIDCSGFTSSVYYLHGILLQRDASQQTMYGDEISTEFEYTDLLPGDLLFFGRKANNLYTEKVTHVAIYIGDGEYIHASGRVRINSMDSARENFSRIYAPRFVRSVRIDVASDSIGIQRIGDNKFYKEMLKL